jgi:hypothetical protein
MTAKLDGTNGLLQQYDYQVPTTGFTYTFAAGTTVLVMNPAGTLATGTITMPAAPADGMTITFSSTQTITALTVSANTGQSIVSAATVLPARQATTYVYRLSNTTWYPMSTVATNVPTTPAGGSTIQTSTVVPSTSGTSIEFTNIPAWVKRITVMFNAVSTGGTANFQIQSGSGSYEITGYSSGSVYLNTSGVPTAIITTGFVMNYSTFASSTTTLTGHYVLTNLTGNTWVGSHILIGGTNGASISGSGVKSFSGVIDRLRIIGSATGNPADTFDAGSINILYE